MKKLVVYTFVAVFIITGIIFVSSINLDLNRDGVVNITDLQIMASNFQGKGSYNASFDLNGNGKVDLFDLVSVARQVDVSNASNGSGGSSNRTVLFHSDWSTATGNSSNAYTDGGKWSPTSPLPYQTVIPVNNDSVGSWPTGMTNILNYFFASGESSGTSEHTLNLYSTPSAGDSIYYRVYMRVDWLQNAGGNSNHDIGPEGGPCFFTWQWLVMPYANGTWELRFGQADMVNETTVSRWSSGDYLNQSKVYRLEWRFKKENNTNRWSMQVRIYDDQNNLVDNESDYTRYSNTPHINLAYPTTIGINDTCMDDGGFLVAKFGTTPTVDINLYYGGVAICSGDWCGPYSKGV